MENKNNEKNIRTKFTLISFLCSILVIYIHTYNLEPYDIKITSTGLAKITYNIETYWSKVTQIAVPIFFMISGVLFYRTFEIANLISKWKKRLASIIFPYFIWCTLYYLYYVLCTNIPSINSILNSDYIVDFSISEWFSWLWIDKYYTLWFIQNLIIFIALAPIIWLLLKNHYKNIPTGIFSLFIFLFIKEKYIGNCTYFLGIEMYLIGSYIGLNCRDALRKKNLAISYFSLAYIIINMLFSFQYWNILSETLFYVAIWYAIDLINISKIEPPWWMSITFFTYVAHDVFLQALKKITYIIGGTSPIYALLNYIIMPLIIEILLIFIAKFMRRYIPYIWKMLIGWR